MNLSRFEVPLTVAAPHFDDESTIVSARQVEPLPGAKIKAGGRRLLALLPLLLAATLCGALGAFTVNYLERRGSLSTLTPSAAGADQDQEPAPAPLPAAVASPSDDRVATPTGSEVEPADNSLGLDSTEKPEPKAQTISPKPDLTEGLVKKNTGQPDPKKLVRQRRVHPQPQPPPTHQNDDPKSRGAGRIQDIFSGPNP